MASLPGTPRTWTNGEVVTPDHFNIEIRDSMRYLKGQLGAVTYSDAVYTTGVGIGMSTLGLSAPQTRFHAGEDSPSYVGVFDNIKTSGTPNGLLVVNNGTGTNRIFSAARRQGDGTYAEIFGVLCNGEILYRGRDLWRVPSQAGALGPHQVTFNDAAILGMTLPVAAAGWWLVHVMVHVSKVGPPNDSLVRLTTTGPGQTATIPIARNNAALTSDNHYSYVRPFAFTGPGNVLVSVREAVDSGGTTYVIDNAHTYMTMMFLGDL